MESKHVIHGGIVCDIDTQETLGTEDRLFADFAGLWYWQARGTADVAGPFASRDEAILDYEAPNYGT